MMRALVLTATLVATAPVAAAESEVATVQLTAFDCLLNDKERVGTGFIVENWLGGSRLVDPAEPVRSAPAGFLLITALHVVDQCASVKVEKVACDQNPPTTPVKNADRRPEGVELADKGRSSDRDLGGREEALARRSPRGLATHGRHTTAARYAARRAWHFQDESCSGGVGFSTGVSRIDNVIMTATGGIDTAQLRGSLDAALRVLLYFSPVAHGASGGPVARLHTNVVLGVHDGGFEKFPFGWSIALGQSGAAIGAPVSGTLDKWPSGFREPKLAQADERVLPGEIRDEVAGLEQRYKRQPYIFSFALPFEFSVAGKELPSWRFVPQLGFVSELMHWPGDTYENAFGVRVAGGAITGRAQERLVAPDNTRFELHDINRDGEFAEMALHLRFRRLQWWRMSVDLGLRLAIVKWTASFGGDLYVMPSVPARVRVSLSLSFDCAGDPRSSFTMCLPVSCGTNNPCAAAGTFCELFDHDCYPVSGICDANQPCPQFGASTMAIACGNDDYCHVQVAPPSAIQMAQMIAPISVTAPTIGQIFSSEVQLHFTWNDAGAPTIALVFDAPPTDVEALDSARWGEAIASGNAADWARGHAIINGVWQKSPDTAPLGTPLYFVVEALDDGKLVAISAAIPVHRR